MEKYEKTIIDLGTGDGRFVYKNAKQNPNNLYIGIDPSQKQLQTYQKKINKDRLENAKLLAGSIELLPTQHPHLKESADVVYINFPWGSLLGAIANAKSELIANISWLIKKGGSVEILFGYSQEAEPTETKRLGLDDLNEDKIRNQIASVFKKNNLYLKQLTNVTKKESFKLDSSWGKKLSFGQERKLYKLVFKNKDQSTLSKALAFKHRYL